MMRGLMYLITLLFFSTLTAAKSQKVLMPFTGSLFTGSISEKWITISFT